VSASAVCLTFHAIGGPEELPDPGGDPGSLRYLVGEDLLSGLLAKLDPSSSCTISELLEKRSGCWTVITFDDGFASDYNRALPILIKTGHRATFFVNSGNVGRAGYMSEAEIRSMAEAGMEIGSHGVNHIYLPPLADDAAKREVEESCKVLSEIVGSKIISYAPVGGHYTRRDVVNVKRAGYSAFVTMTPGVTRLPGPVKRNHIQRGYTLERALRIASGDRLLNAVNLVRYYGLLLPKKLLGLECYDRLKGAITASSRGSGGQR